MSPSAPRSASAWISLITLVLAFASGRASATSLPVDGEWSELAPAFRTEHVAVYDATRDRILIFGGQNAGTDFVWSVTLSGEWTEVRTSGAPPVSRTNLAGIYDPVRDRLVVFGGFPGPGGSSAWALTLAGDPTWSEIVTGTPQPSTRFYHSAVYDPVRDRMLVFFGGSGTNIANLRNDVWALSLSGTPAWTQLLPSGTAPAARAWASAVYDPLRDRVVLFGGFLGCQMSGWEPICETSPETWSLDLANGPAWSQVLPPGAPPPERMSHGGIYDPVRDRLVVFGGENVGYFTDEWFNDTWSLPLGAPGAWSAVTTSGIPPEPRRNTTAVYDDLNDRMIVCGGEPLYGSLLGNLWVLPLSTNAWSEVSPAIPAHTGHTAEYDPDGDRMIVFGGRLWGDDFFPDSLYDETWSLKLDGSSDWTKLAIAGTLPPRRHEHVSIYDPRRRRIVIFGGTDNSQNLNDVWALSLADPPGWTEIVPSGTPPPGLVASASVYDSEGDRMLITGGYSGGRRAETWALNLSGPPHWDLLPAVGGTPVSDHTAIYDPVRNRVVVFGGTRSDFTNETWVLSLTGTPTWTHLLPAGTLPPPHFWHTAVHDLVGDRMLVNGGRGSSSLYPQTWSLSLAGSGEWTQLAPARQTPPGRWNHTAVMDTRRRRMVIFGGDGPYYGQDRNDIWALSFGEAPVGVPEERAPVALSLRAPSPNPFATSTTIHFVMEASGGVEATIFDVAGRRVSRLLNETRNAGAYDLTWNGRDEAGREVPAGVYFVRVEALGTSLTTRVVVLR